MTSDAGIRWIVAVIDRPYPWLSEAAGFWATVSGTVAQNLKYGRFVELRRDHTDDWLLAQGLVDGPGGVHLDLSVTDPDRFARRAVAAGATVVAVHNSWTVLISPSGVPFCVAAWKGEDRCPAPSRRVSRVDRVCLDVAPSAYGAEAAFWPALTGWPIEACDVAGLSRLRSPETIPINVWLQRLDEERPASLHVDVTTSAMAATRAWHESLGAACSGVGPHGTVLLDPAGAPYCLVEDKASTGLR